MPCLLTSISTMALTAAEMSRAAKAGLAGGEMCPRRRCCRRSALWQTADSPDPQERGQVISPLCTPVSRLQKRDYNSADPSQAPVSTGLWMAEAARADSLQQGDPCAVLIADATAKTQVLCQDLGHIFGT